MAEFVIKDARSIEPSVEFFLSRAGNNIDLEAEDSNGTHKYILRINEDGTLRRNMFCTGLAGVQTDHCGRVKFEDEE